MNHGQCVPIEMLEKRSIFFWIKIVDPKNGKKRKKNWKTRTPWKNAHLKQMGPKQGGVFSGPIFVLCFFQKTKIVPLKVKQKMNKKIQN